MTLLDVRGLTAGYGDSKVLDDVTLPPLEAGKLVALVGPNAAGKSTLLKAIAGLVRLKSGKVAVGGVDLAELRLEERARHVRYVPQVYATTVRLSVFEAVLVARKLTGPAAPSREDVAAVRRTLARVGISHLAERQLARLSGGQQQLVALAQGLVRPSAALLLDEPTSALDLRHQLEAVAIMRDAAREEGRLVVAAMHDLNLAARHADLIVVLSDGRVAAVGDPAQIVADSVCEATYGVRLLAEHNRRGSLTIEAYL